jgi:hypothetical protein
VKIIAEYSDHEWITHSNFKTWRWEPDGTSAVGGADYIEIELVEIH